MASGTDGGGRQYTPQRAQTPVARREIGAPTITRSAPVRGGDTARGVIGGRREIGLTAGEIQQATDGTIPWRPHDAPKPEMVGEPIGTTEFARRKMLMMREGRYMSNQGE